MHTWNERRRALVMASRFVSCHMSKASRAAPSRNCIASTVASSSSLNPCRFLLRYSHRIQTCQRHPRERISS